MGNKKIKLVKFCIIIISCSISIIAGNAGTKDGLSDAIKNFLNNKNGYSIEKINKEMDKRIKNLKDLDLVAREMNRLLNDGININNAIDVTRGIFLKYDDLCFNKSNDWRHRRVDSQEICNLCIKAFALAKGEDIERIVYVLLSALKREFLLTKEKEVCATILNNKIEMARYLDLILYVKWGTVKNVAINHYSNNKNTAGLNLLKAAYGDTEAKKGILESIKNFRHNYEMLNKIEYLGDVEYICEVIKHRNKTFEIQYGCYWKRVANMILFNDSEISLPIVASIESFSEDPPKEVALLFENTLKKCK